MTATVVHSPLPLGRPVNVPPAVRRGAWQLKSGQAITLRAAGQSVLKVRQGRVWVTCDATATWGSEDLVLGPGESLRVTQGQRLVMEPWDCHGATYTWDAA
jgi:ferric-dicitrate binding protein FerR (iron transport regulator)